MLSARFNRPFHVDLSLTAEGRDGSETKMKKLAQEWPSARDSSSVDVFARDQKFLQTLDRSFMPFAETLRKMETSLLMFSFRILSLVIKPKRMTSIGTCFVSFIEV
jgi:hypothetical protein